MIKKIMDIFKLAIAAITAYFFLQKDTGTSTTTTTSTGNTTTDTSTSTGSGTNGTPSPVTIQINDLTDFLPKHPTKSYGTRSLSQITEFFLHHSLTNSGSALAYANFHIEPENIINGVNKGGNDWPGIGYHFVIDKDGTIQQTNRLTTRSYHVSNHNTSGIGICLTGNYDIQHPPQAQINAAVLLCQYLSGSLGRFVPIYGHNKFSSKTCPGTHLNVQEIERRVYDPV